jgi:hypothetical protein
VAVTNYKKMGIQPAISKNIIVSSAIFMGHSTQKINNVLHNTGLSTVCTLNASRNVPLPG